jgi:hypothetical protein
MGRRLDLQKDLEKALGSKHVYFQPPANVHLEYPCIVYHRDLVDELYADNFAYRRLKRYQVTVIDRNPDSPIPDRVAALPLCSFSRFFTSENLNHDIFTIYF